MFRDFYLLRRRLAMLAPSTKVAPSGLYWLATGSLVIGQWERTALAQPFTRG